MILFSDIESNICVEFEINLENYYIRVPTLRENQRKKLLHNHSPGIAFHQGGIEPTDK